MSVHIQTGRKAQFKAALKRAKSMWFMYVLLIPFLVLLYIYHYRPMYGVTLAFKKFYILKGIAGSPWVGFKYFDQLFSAYSFWEVFRNTLLISLYKLIFGFPMPIILALFLNELKNAKLKKAFQTISYLPHFLSWVILAGIVNNVFSPSRGIVNYFRTLLGLDTVYYMASTDHFRGILVISSIWATVGWSSIIYIAAISGVDQQLYEAAMLDGAKKMQLIWHVTLPYIRPIISMVMTAAMEGTVTWIMRWKRVAPSISAASYNSGAIPVMAAR